MIVALVVPAGCSSLAAIGVVLAAATYRAFDLDRFFVPKELVLHVGRARCSRSLVLRRAPSLALRRLDLLLGGVPGAQHGERAASRPTTGSRRARWRSRSRARGIFWAARATADAGARRTIVAAAARGGGARRRDVAGPGVRRDERSTSASTARRAARSATGTSWRTSRRSARRRSIFATITARRGWTAALGTVGLAIIAAALVLSRSRAAWLALAAGAGLLALGLWRAHRRWSEPKAARRMRAARRSPRPSGILAALLLPNTLEWKSDSPYLDTVTGVVNYREGSGRGRDRPVREHAADRGRASAARRRAGELGGGVPEVRRAERSVDRLGRRHDVEPVAEQRLGGDRSPSAACRRSSAVSLVLFGLADGRVAARRPGGEHGRVRGRSRAGDDAAW